MANALLWRGGTPVTKFPVCDGCAQFDVPFPKRVAYEYATGEFTIGDRLEPANRPYQQCDLTEAELTADDLILQFIIPAEHILTGVQIAVRETDPLMAGLTLKPIAVLYDATAKTYTPLTILDDRFEAFSVDTKFSAYAPIQTSQDLVIPEQTIPGDPPVVIPEQTVTTTSAAPYYVESGKTLLIGFQVVTMPTNAENKIADTTAIVSIAGKVGGFDIPHHM